MTISKELFLSILSMDAYNRGYGAKIADSGENDPDGLGESGQIGTATLKTRPELNVSDATYDAWKSASFYAIAYSIDATGPEDLAGKTVISYRGTDQIMPVWGETWGDLLQGWTLGAGDPDAGSQGNLSLAFYAAATGPSAEQILDARTTSNTFVTGHSLGGGLARRAFIERIAA